MRFLVSSWSTAGSRSVDRAMQKRPGGLSALHRRDDALDDPWIEFHAREREVRRMQSIKTALAPLAVLPFVAAGFWIHQEWRDAIEAFVRFR